MFGEITHCDIGWCLTDPEGGFAFAPPRTVFSTRSRPLGARAIQNCPAVNALERQIVEIPSPVTLRLALEEEAGGPALAVIDQGTFVQPERIGEMLALEPPARWRHPKKPVLTLTLPLFLVTDTPCCVSLVPPFLGAPMRRWPGSMVAARWPLWLWPQTLVWAFEWDRPGEQLTLRQGEPLAYALLEFNHPQKRPRLVEAELTPELADYRAGMQGIHHITGDLEAIWAAAGARRPRRLLVPRETAAAQADAAGADGARADAARADTAPADAGRTDAAQADAARADGARADAAGSDVPRADAALADAARVDTARADGARTDAARADPAQADATGVDDARADAARADAARADAAQADTVPADAGRTDAVQADAARADGARADTARTNAAGADKARADVA
ncbi:hypothetical protein LNKW23_05450 [Paralimibaculum aggregatum]|uniref:Uncharacterized protein n=1 Tax=Paralimibaculum aggregatum TaxID=3036245 RepID=A0ABQ6LD96_9RHOB|nr:hypothetical protein [Limibaculum sp. NKW23]GMG81332.1 hypothetical protein LNKW23_05450 [Limibaculum sp. NKW23]